MTPVFSEVLLEAWTVLEQSGWCRGYLALDDAGCSVSANSYFATSFCSIGAVSRCCSKLGTKSRSPNYPISKTIRYLDRSAHWFGYRVKDGLSPSVNLNDNARPKTVEEMWMLATLLALSDESNQEVEHHD